MRAPGTVRTLLAGFASTEAAGDAVSRVIAAGILPAAIEMMDALTVEAVEAAVGAGYPAGAGAVLIVELDGPAVEVELDTAAVEQICVECGGFGLHIAKDAAERARIWRGRKSAFAAMGRISNSYYVQDGVVPRTRLPTRPGCASRASSTPATATSTRWCSTTSGSRANPNARRSLRRRSSACASTRAAR
jgi:glycolate oxidase